MRDSRDLHKTQEISLEPEFTPLECIAADVPGLIYQLQRDRHGFLAFPFLSSSVRTFLELDATAVQTDANLLLSKIHREDRVRFDRSLERSAAEFVTWVWQGRLILESGEIVWVQTSARPRKKRDKSILWQGLLVEVSRELQNPRSPIEMHLKDRSSPRKTQLLEEAIENLPQACFWKDLSFKYLGCNRQFAQLIGLQNPKEIVGKTDRDLPWKPEIIQALQALDKQAIAYRSPVRQILESPRPTHSPQTWFDTQKTLLHDESDNPMAILGTMEDITERKQLDKALLDYQNELLTLFRAMQDVILVFDDEGCFLRIVPTNPPQFCRTPPDVIGKTLHDVLPASTADFLVGQIQTSLETQTTIQLEHLLNLGGIETWFDVSIAPLKDRTVIWVARNITERKQAELECSQSQQQLQAILDYAPALISIENLAGEYMVLNRQAQEVRHLNDRGLSKSTAGDEPAPDIAQPDQHGLQRRHGDVVDLERPISKEEILSLPDGLHTYLTVKFPLKNSEGQIYAIGGISTDITQQKLAEETSRRKEAKLRHKTQQLEQNTQQLEQTLWELRQTQAKLIHTEKMSSLGQLVAGVAHEINNPANFIHANLNHARIYVEDLLQLVKAYQTQYPEATPAIQEIAEEIDLDFIFYDLPKLLSSMQVGTQRIRRVVQSLRTFSRVDEAERKRVDLHEGIESTLIMLQHRLEPKPDMPEIKVIREYGEFSKIECYAGQLNQVFLNIITNGIDALEEAIATGECSTPQIIIQTEVLEGDRISICIRDNGPGISESVQKRMFDPFFTTKPVGKGTGIGMSICDRIITHLHGGELQCISQPGEGAMFKMMIPMGVGESAEGAT